jgi:hypothetical protein
VGFNKDNSLEDFIKIALTAAIEPMRESKKK